MKTNLAEKILTRLTWKLGHVPTPLELSKELNGMGLVILAESIVNETPDYVSFAENIDSELEDILIPYINNEVRCPQCSSYDKWEYADADYEGDKKFFRFICQGHTDPDNATFGNRSGSTWPNAFCLCEYEVTIYLDKNNKPIFEGKKK